MPDATISLEQRLTLHLILCLSIRGHKQHAHETDILSVAVKDAKLF